MGTSTEKRKIDLWMKGWWMRHICNFKICMLLIASISKNIHQDQEEVQFEDDAAEENLQQQEHCHQDQEEVVQPEDEHDQ
eukprot:1984073-Ditylum_brightwellii.AAC.1